MSDQTEHHEEHDEHSSPIKTPKQLIVVVVLAFILPVLIIILLVNVVSSSSVAGAGSDSLSEEATVARIAPVAKYNTAPVIVAAADAGPKKLKSGEEVYKSLCMGCHDTGVSGAPKFGDSGAWAPRLKAGQEEVVKLAIHGLNAMPPKGGDPSLSDLEVERAVVYIANHSGGAFKEPAAPEGDGAAAPAEGAAPAKEAAPAEGATPAKEAAPAEGAAPAKEAAPAEGAAPAQPSAEGAAAGAAAGATAGATAAAAGDSKLAEGEALYKQICFACHDAGVAGAPKFGDKAAWDARIATGMDKLYDAALHGLNAMPPKGGSSAPDDVVKAAVDYMVKAVK